MSITIITYLHLNFGSKSTRKKYWASAAAKTASDICCFSLHLKLEFHLQVYRYDEKDKKEAFWLILLVVKLMSTSEVICSSVLSSTH